MSIDYALVGETSRPQEGRNPIIQGSIDALNNHEFNKMNRILDDYYNETPSTILDQPLGKIMNNTVNFFGNSINSYYSKLMEAEFMFKLQGDTSYIDMVKIHLIALSLFIRDNDNIIYLGILMIILSVLICFFNISRTHGNP
tara:strand:+ start:540 stop:965 length:426 start_codon:yes stop_codon:yes gene_type:complete